MFFYDYCTGNKLLGWKDNPYPWIKNAELLVLSSQLEGLPTVLIESLILNTPVDSTNCKSGTNEILIDNLQPYLAKVNSVDDLSKKIELALQNKIDINPKLYQRFSDNDIAKKYLDVIVV